MDKILKILIVEDVKTDAELVWQEIKKNNIVFEKLLVENREDYMEGLKNYLPDLIISDFSLPLFDGMSALLLRNEHAPLTPFILVTGSINEEIAVECMKAGADDYVLKDNLSRLGSAVNNSLNKIRLLKQKTNAEELAHNERRMLRTLIDNLPDPIYVLDKDGRKVIANKADVKNIGYLTEKEVLGKTDIELFPGETGIRGNADNMEVISTGKPIFEREEDFITVEGSKLWLLTTKIPLRNKEGMITGLVGIGYDITRRKLDEAELIKAKEKAEESDRLKTAFLHNISHEIRTPMNAIVGFSLLLKEPDIDAASRQAYTEIITQSSNQLLSIITDIVDISNIDADLVRIDKKEINLNETLRKLYDQFALRAKEKNLAFSYLTELADSEVILFTDGTKLIQILSNLLSNAFKFTSTGSVRFGYAVRKGLIEFFVEDTGIGVQKEYHLRVFDRFFQIKDQKSRLYEGTGLGLSISKAYVEHMGGTIWLSSDPGKVTSFFFTIPYEKEDVKNSDIKEPVAPDGFAFAIKKTILIAEDIDSNFKLLKYFLSRANVDIIRAVNGKEAVEKCLSTDNIDLVLMDIKMPVMDGYTAVKLIREKNTTIPIIAQTAYADDRDEAIKCGCSGYISKPFDKKSLLKVLSEFK